VIDKAKRERVRPTLFERHRNRALSLQALEKKN